MSDILPPQEVARQQELTYMLDGMRQGRMDILIGERPIQLERQLGTGGTKMVLHGIDEIEYQKHKEFLGGEAFKYNNPNSVTNTISRKLQQRVLS